MVIYQMRLLSEKSWYDVSERQYFLATNRPGVYATRVLTPVSSDPPAAKKPHGPRLSLSELDQRIVALLRREGALAPREILDMLSADVARAAKNGGSLTSLVYNRLTRLSEEGRVTSPARGRWTAL